MKLLIFCALFGLAVGKIAIPSYPYERSGIVKLTPENYKDVLLPKSPAHVELTAHLYKLKKYLNVTDDTTFYADLNAYADQLIGNLDGFCITKGWDPASLPEVREEMSADILWLIPYTGTLDMWYGTMKGSSSIFRSGDAFVTYNEETRHVSVQVPIGFHEINVKYEYALNFPWVFSSRGNVEGGLTEMRMNIGIGIDTRSGIITLDDYSVIDSGHISIYFHTYSIFPNWTWNLLFNTCTAIFNGLILDAIQSGVTGVLNTAINTLNTIIQAIMNA